MTSDSVVERLRSGNLSDRISATYELDAELMRLRPDILQALRENLLSAESDLLEITIMRLSIRANDCESFDAIQDIFLSSRDDLVLSACAFGLASLSHCGDQCRSRSIALLKAKAATTKDAALKEIFEDQARILVAK